MGDVETGLKKMGVRGWRKIARDGDACKLMLMEAKVLHGPYREREREYTC
jgi:hypothetical protein